MPELVPSQVVEDSTSALFILQNIQGGEDYKNVSYYLPRLNWDVWIEV